MNTDFPSSTNEWAAQLATERARREQAEAALAATQAQLAAHEQAAAATDRRARRHQSQLEALVENQHVGLVLVDDEGQVQFVNHYFYELFGLTPVIPAPGAPIPPESLHVSPIFRDPAAFARRARALLAAGHTVLGEEWTLADGRVVELDYLVLDAVGAGHLICYRDVTERHQQNEELRTLAHLQHHNPNPILRLAASGEVLYANPAASPDLLALGAQGGLLPLVQAARQAAAPHQQELAVGRCYYLCTAVAMPGQSFTTLYLTDITLRQQAKEQLAKQQAFYETILEQLPTAVAVFNADHRYQFVNPTIEPDPAVRAAMLGRTMAEVGRRPPEVVRLREAAFDQAVREQREVAWEEAIDRPGREPLQLIMRFRPVFNADGQLQFLMSSGSDITELKQAEKKMAEQQAFYESILNLLPVDVAVFDAEHRFLFVNPSSIADPLVRQQVVGMSNHEYIAFRQQYQPPGTDQQREQYFDLAVRTRTDVSWEEMRTDRRRRPQLIMRHLRPVFGADGRLRMVVGSGIDITARYTAEQLQHKVQVMLAEQQQFIRQILDALPSVVYLVEPDGSVSFKNQAYDDLIVHSQHWLAAGASPAVREEMRQMRRLNQEVLQAGKALTRELPYTLVTGEVRYFEVHKRPLQRAGGQVGVLTVSTDVTQVKLARQELEHREKQYHDLVYYSQALICTHDLHGTVLSVNPAIEQLLGLPAARLVGHHLREALPPEYHAELQAYLSGNQLLQMQDRTVIIRTAGGEQRYLRYYTYQVAEPGHPAYVVASGYDVTAGVLAQRSLQQAKREAEENAQAKEAFLARMSHEIRTPLNGVLGMAALLQKTPLNPAQQEYLRTMQHAGRHLLALLNDVLDMAKITTGHLALDHAPFDLAVALQGAGQTVAALAAQKGLHLSILPLLSASPLVLGDAYRLHQVLLNLLGNAIKFTETGSVSLGADVLCDTATALTVRLWVQDTGIGIEPAEQMSIFEVFTQAGTEASQRFGGTGLGLAISQQLVQQMGGTLVLRSVPGQGTTFAFELTLPRPAARPAEHAPRPAQVASFEPLRGLRVLLAEDNVVNQQIAVAVLSHQGVQVDAVDNGLEALARLRTGQYEAAILDIKMPGLSGVEVTAAIRASAAPAVAGIPIIALTANAFAADRASYLAAGMDACLTKPYEEADLCQLLLSLTAAG